MKVLIIDSEQRFVSQAQKVLESQGHQVLAESSVREALGRTRQWKPDAVVVDCETPQCCDGQLLAGLAAAGNYPAVVLTASLDRFDAAWRAWQRGGDELVFKPLIHRDELHQALLTAKQSSLCGRRAKPFAQAA